MMRIAPLLSLVATFVLTPLHAQSASPAAWTDPALAARLGAWRAGSAATWASTCGTCAPAPRVEMNADSVFPTASLVKVPILLTLYDQVEQGRLDLDARVPYPDTLQLPLRGEHGRGGIHGGRRHASALANWRS